jgi:hypothetical protein
MIPKLAAVSAALFQANLPAILRTGGPGTLQLPEREESGRVARHERNTRRMFSRLGIDEDVISKKRRIKPVFVS